MRPYTVKAKVGEPNSWFTFDVNAESDLEAIEKASYGVDNFFIKMRHYQGVIYTLRRTPMWDRVFEVVNGIVDDPDGVDLFHAVNDIIKIVREGD